MKNILKTISLFAIMAILSTTVSAQLRTKIVLPVNIGNNIILGTLPNTITGTGLADTLGVSDTISYIIPVNGTLRYLPFISIGWTKIGSGTATITASFYQGNTSSNCSSTVKAGSANGVYTKTLTYSATTTTPSYIDFLSDSAKVSGKYLKVQYITSSTASVQGSIITNANTSAQ